jgi:hypothetical protein
MKAHRRITRAVRALAVTGCVASIVLPASATAHPLDYHPLSPQAKAIAAAQAHHPIASTPGVVVREITRNAGDHSLAIVLASVALGIALCGSAYAVIRTTRLQRRLARSS